MSQQASAIITEIQRAAKTAEYQIANINGLVGKYDVIVATFGEEYLSSHFLDADGNPREDLGGITFADIQAVIEGLREVCPVITQHLAKFVKIGI